MSDSKSTLQILSNNTLTDNAYRNPKILYFIKQLSGEDICMYSLDLFHYGILVNEIGDIITKRPVTCHLWKKKSTDLLLKIEKWYYLDNFRRINSEQR